MTQLEWMIINVEKLVNAIAEDGKLDGPISQPLLMECIQYTGREVAAKWILKQALEKRGLGRLLKQVEVI